MCQPAVADPVFSLFVSFLFQNPEGHHHIEQGIVIAQIQIYDFADLFHPVKECAPVDKKLLRRLHGIELMLHIAFERMIIVCMMLGIKSLSSRIRRERPALREILLFHVPAYSQGPPLQNGESTYKVLFFRPPPGLPPPDGNNPGYEQNR